MLCFFTFSHKTTVVKKQILDPSVDTRYSLTWAFTHRHDVTLLPALLADPTYYNPHLESPDAHDGVLERMEYEDFMSELAECGAAAVPELAKVLRSDRQALRETAVGALARMMDDAAVPPLIEALGLDDVQADARHGLQIHGARAIDALMTAAHDTLPLRRRNALINAAVATSNQKPETPTPLPAAARPPSARFPAMPRWAGAGG